MCYWCVMYNLWARGAAELSFPSWLEVSRGQGHEPCLFILFAIHWPSSVGWWCHAFDGIHMSSTRLGTPQWKESITLTPSNAWSKVWGAYPCFSTISTTRCGSTSFGVGRDSTRSFSRAMRPIGIVRIFTRFPGRRSWSIFLQTMCILP